MIFSTWQLQFKYCNTAQYLKRISLLVFFKVQTMSDLVSDCERQKVGDNLRISSPAKKYRSREDIDDSQIALSVEIPYYLLNEWHGRVNKSDPSSKRSQLHHS